MIKKKYIIKYDTDKKLNSIKYYKNFLIFFFFNGLKLKYYFFYNFFFKYLFKHYKNETFINNSLINILNKNIINYDYFFITLSNLSQKFDLEKNSNLDQLNNLYLNNYVNFLKIYDISFIHVNDIDNDLLNNVNLNSNELFIFCLYINMINILNMYKFFVINLCLI